MVCKGGTGKAEAAKLPDAGIGLKQCPEKCAAEKGLPTELRNNRYVEMDPVGSDLKNGSKLEFRAIVGLARQKKTAA